MIFYFLTPNALNLKGYPCLGGNSNFSGMISKLSGSSTTLSSSLSLSLLSFLVSYFFFSTFFFRAQLIVYVLLPKFSIKISLMYALWVKITPKLILFRSSLQNIVKSVPLAFKFTSMSTPCLMTKNNVS
jgi:hypothetical protein